MQGVDDDVQVPQQQRLVPARPQQKVAHIGLQEGSVGRDPTLELLRRQGIAPHPRTVVLKDIDSFSPLLSLVLGGQEESVVVHRRHSPAAHPPG